MTETPRTPIRVLLVDDSELVRRGIKTVLSTQSDPPMRVVGEAGNVAEAVTECLRHQPHIVLLDIRLPTAPASMPAARFSRSSPKPESSCSLRTPTTILSTRR